MADPTRIVGFPINHTFRTCTRFIGLGCHVAEIYFSNNYSGHAPCRKLFSFKTFRVTYRFFSLSPCLFLPVYLLRKLNNAVNRQLPPSPSRRLAVRFRRVRRSAHVFRPLFSGARDDGKSIELPFDSAVWTPGPGRAPSSSHTRFTRPRSIWNYFIFSPPTKTF